MLRCSFISCGARLTLNAKPLRTDIILILRDTTRTTALFRSGTTYGATYVIKRVLEMQGPGPRAPGLHVLRRATVVFVCLSQFTRGAHQPSGSRVLWAAFTCKEFPACSHFFHTPRVNDYLVISTLRGRRRQHHPLCTCDHSCPYRTRITCPGCDIRTKAEESHRLPHARNESKTHIPSGHTRSEATHPSPVTARHDIPRILSLQKERTNKNVTPAPTHRNVPVAHPQP